MTLTASLAQLETADLVRRATDAEPGYQFKHTLTQETVYQSLLRAKRREIHAHVARAYEEAYADRLDEIAALLAQHYGEAGEDAKTLEYAARAGDAAARIYANAEALEYYSRAIDTARRVVGATHLPHHDSPRSTEAVSQPEYPQGLAQASASPLRDLYLKRGRVLELLGRIDDALANYREMRSLARERSDRALELGGLIALATLYATPTIAHDVEEAKRLSDDALLTAREIGDRASEAKILWNLQNLASFSNDAAAGIVYGEQALVVARQFNLREQTAYVLNDISRTYLAMGEHVQAMRAIQDAKKLWYELGNVPMLADNLATASETCAYAGALGDALDYSKQAIQLAQSIGNDWVQAYARWTEGIVHFEQGDVGRAIATMDESRRRAEQAGFAAALLGGQSDLGLMYSSLGAFDHAIELCKQTVEHGQRFLPFLPWALAILSRIYTHKGDLRVAAQTARQARDRFQSSGYIVYLTVPLALAEGDLALAQKDYPNAVSAVAPVIARFHETGIGYRVVEAWLVQARAWLAQGDLDRADEALREAHTVADRTSARQALWQVRLEQSRVADARGEPAQAKTLRAQARDTVNYIVDHIGNPELCASFLALPDVRAVMGPS